jgi:hypothetical protein
MIYLKIAFVGYDHKKAIPLMWIEETVKDNLGEINDYITNVKSGYEADGYVGVVKRFDTINPDAFGIVLNGVQTDIVVDGLTEDKIKEYVGRVI